VCRRGTAAVVLGRLNTNKHENCRSPLLLRSEAHVEFVYKADLASGIDIKLREPVCRAIPSSLLGAEPTVALDLLAFLIFAQTVVEIWLPGPKPARKGCLRFLSLNLCDLVL
jgi:hypothetical protein